MAVKIAGMQVALGSCSSLALFERAVYKHETCIENGVHDISRIAEQTLLDAEIKNLSNLTLICSPQSRLVNLPKKLGLNSSQYEIILPDGSSEFHVLSQVDRLIQVNPQRNVLLTLTDTTKTVSLFLVHPNQDIPAYAVVEFIPLDIFSNPDIKPSGLDFISYFEIPWGIGSLDQKDFDFLCSLFPDVDGAPRIALGSLKSYQPAGPGLENLAFTALLISRRHIPECRETLNPAIVPPDDHPFYLPDCSRPWLDQGPGYNRSALIFPGKEPTGSGIWLVKETSNNKLLPRVRPRLRNNEPYLIPLAGGSLTDIEHKLEVLSTKLEENDSLKSIVQDAYTNYVQGNDPLVLSIVGASREEILNELHHARMGLLKTTASQQPWTSPKGSYFTNAPLGREGLAFVYPGAFNSYPYMAQDLFDYFPVLHHAARQIIPNTSHSLSEKNLFPRSLHPVSETSEADLMAEFYNHPAELIESGISLSVLYTIILKEVFNLQPTAALGYSLGEISMLWANGVWQNAEQSSQAWKESALFKSQLFGQMTTLREYWNDSSLGNEFWSSFILKAAPDAVQAVLQKESRVYMTIINTPNEVVIAGESKACQQVIKKLGCRALPMPFNAAIHNPAMASTYPDFVQLYTNDVTQQKGIQFYSTADYQILTQETNSLARAMAKMTCNPVNFPDLVEKAYQDGIRIFIEVGPQKTCSRWIERILESKPHEVISINKRHQADFNGVLKVLSMAVSHRVPLDLSALYPDSSAPISTAADQQADFSLPMNKKLKHALPPNRRKPTAAMQPHPEPQLIPADIQTSYLEHMTRLSSDIGAVHQNYLEGQSVITRNIITLLDLHENLDAQELDPVLKQAPVFNKNQIIQFTTGNHQACFGDLFAPFGSRRIPRLPNGPLRFIDQIIHMIGQQGCVRPGSNLISEVKVAPGSWYLAENEDCLPHVSLMEMALQPCGFLSAYMGTIKDKSHLDLYFRNLDGEGTLLFWPELPEIITNQVELISSSTLQDVIIQEYSFTLFSADKPFYKGKSSFGYFTQPMLINQTGLDGNQTTTPWIDSNPEAGSWKLLSSKKPAAFTPHLPTLTKIWISKSGGAYQNGYLYGTLDLANDAWFYKAHFFQDPVMPGSLGVEAMARAIISASPEWGIPHNAQWRVKPNRTTTWKYRGQITPPTSQAGIELHIKEFATEDRNTSIVADGTLWKKNKRIYQIENIALETIWPT